MIGKVSTSCHCNVQLFAKGSFYPEGQVTLIIFGVSLNEMTSKLDELELSSKLVLIYTLQYLNMEGNVKGDDYRITFDYFCPSFVFLFRSFTQLLSHRVLLPSPYEHMTLMASFARRTPREFVCYYFRTFYSVYQKSSLTAPQ